MHRGGKLFHLYGEGSPQSGQRRLHSSVIGITLLKMGQPLTFLPPLFDKSFRQDPAKRNVRKNVAPLGWRWGQIASIRAFVFEVSHEVRGWKATERAN